MQQIWGNHQLYCEAGERDDLPPLLLIHGFLSSRAQWRDNLADLSNFVRPVLVELPSHGRSPAPEDISFYELEMLLGEIDLIRSALGYERWSVCGHSLGGAVALNYSLAFPDRVDALIFTNSRSALEASNGSLRKDASPALEAIRKGGVAALEALPFHPMHMRGVSHALKSEIVEDASRIDPLGLANLMDRALANISVRPRIDEIAPPVLLINGVRERSFQEVRQWLEKVRPEFDIVDLDAGHSPNAELPNQFNAVIRAFLAAL